MKGRVFKMNKKIIILLIGFILIPMRVKANITCNDGTISSTCQDCHTGCCSRHGGCTNNPNSNGGGYTPSNNYSYNPTPEPESAPVPETTPNSTQTTEPTEEPPKQESNDSEDDTTVKEEESYDKQSNESTQANENNEDDSAAGLGVLGLLVAGTIIGHKASKK